jgi:hypothetical protein
VQVEHRDEFPGGEAAQGARRPAHADVDAGRGVAHQLELRRQVHVFEGHAQRALDDLLAGDDQPEQGGQRHGHELETDAAHARNPHQMPSLR